MKENDPRRDLIARTPLACPLCAMPKGPSDQSARLSLLRVESGPAGERRKCRRCGLVCVFPRVALAGAIRRRS